MGTHLVAGTSALVLTVISSGGATVRIGWAVAAAIFMYMGATLMATFAWQRRSRSIDC